MNIDYLIRLWESSNLDTILIKDLPLARGTDKVIVQPTLILDKNQKVIFGEELSSFDYLKLLFKNSIFEYIESTDILIVKVIYKFGDK